MKNTRWYICYDWETDGKNPHEANPVQLAAVPIEPLTLEIKKEFMFNVTIRPPGIDKDEYFTDDVEATIQWHANNLGITTDEVIEKWKNGVPQKTAWKNFCTFCAKYEVDKKFGQWYPAPIPMGYNIITYDNIISERMAKKHKTKMPFSTVNKIDIFDMMYMWLNNLDEPQDFKMDTLRKWFGMKTTGAAHDAETDVLEEAAIGVRFLKFMKKQSRVDKFKGSFA